MDVGSTHSHRSSATRLATGALAAIAASLALAASAEALPQGAFDCRASVIRMSGASEPITANTPGEPCQRGAASAPATAVKGSPGEAEAQSPSATTATTLHNPPANGDGGSATASGQSVRIVSSQTVITADAVSAQAGATCSAGAPSTAASSSVTNLVVNGSSVTVTGGPQDVPTPIGTLHLNQTITSSGTTGAGYPFTVVDQRAMSIHIGPSGDIIVGDAQAGSFAAPCTNGPNPWPPPPTPVPSFTCSASAVLGTSLGAPFTANMKSSPCVAADAFLANGGVANGSTSEAALWAHTELNPDVLPTPPVPSGDGVLARAGVSNLDLFGGSAEEIKANSANSSITAVCRAGSVAFTTSSQVTGLNVAGHALDITAPTTMVVPGGTLYLNWVQRSGNSIEVRALWFRAFNGNFYVAGDSKAGYTANPC